MDVTGAQTRDILLCMTYFRDHRYFNVVSTIVEAVTGTYDRLHAAFREQEGVRATDEASAVVVEDA